MSSATLSTEERIVREEVESYQSLFDKASYIPHQPTVRQRLFLDLDGEEAFYGGAAGGGKSDALLMAALQYVDVPGYSALLLRRTLTDLTLPESLIPRSHEWLHGSGAYWQEKETGGKPGKTWVFPSGATITFGYLESENDKYRYQSSAFQFVGFDELTQFTDTQYLYLFSRLRRLEGVNIPPRMRSASNPGGVGAEWVKARFIPDDFLPQDADHPTVFEKVVVSEADEQITCSFVPAKLKDNPYLDEIAYRRSLDRLDRVTREQLLHGDWTITASGRGYFDPYALARFQPRRGTDGELFVEYENGRQLLVFAPRDNGILSIWRRPERGRFYSVGADTATGKDAMRGEGSAKPDYSVAQVRDVDTGEQVARLRGRITEGAFGQYLFMLCNWYNLAYVVPEVTGGYGRAMLDKLLDLGYPPERIYWARDEERIGTPLREELGWTTSSATRPKLLYKLSDAIQRHTIETYDPATIHEYNTFEVNKDGKAEARVGCHDDCVIADALSVVGIERMPKLLSKLRLVQPSQKPTKYRDPLRDRIAQAMK